MKECMIGNVALKLTDDLFDLLTNIEEEHQLQYTELRDIDAKINDIYHVIEYVRMDAVKMMKVYKLLQDCLIKRRIIKNNLSAYSSIISDKRATDIKNRIMAKRKSIEARNEGYHAESTDSYAKLFE
jgi:hypothetical protein